MASLRIIPATIDLATSAPIASKAKRKVAGYARVSTDNEEQQTSYAAQVMDVHTGRETEGELKALGFTEQERAEMITFARELNKAYFSGDLRLADTWDPDGHIAALWAASGTLRDYYMRSVIPDYGQDYTHWE